MNVFQATVQARQNLKLPIHRRSTTRLQLSVTQPKLDTGWAGRSGPAALPCCRPAGSQGPALVVGPWPGTGCWTLARTDPAAGPACPSRQRRDRGHGLERFLGLSGQPEPACSSFFGVARLFPNGCSGPRSGSDKTGHGPRPPGSGSDRGPGPWG